MEELTLEDKEIAIPSEKQQTSNLVLDVETPKISQESVLARQQALTQQAQGQAGQTFESFMRSRKQQEEALIGSLGRGQALAGASVDTGRLEALQAQADRLGEVEAEETAELIKDSQRRGRVARQLTGLQGVQAGLQEARRDTLTRQLETEQSRVDAQLESEKEAINAYFDEQERIVDFRRELAQDNKDLFTTFSARGFEAAQAELNREQKMLDNNRADAREANTLKSELLTKNMGVLPPQIQEAVMGATTTSEIFDIPGVSRYFKDPVQAASLALKSAQLTEQRKKNEFIEQQTKQMEDGQVLLTDEQADMAFKFQSDYDKQSQDFRDVAQAYGKVAASASDPSGAGDVSMIFAYMKMLDPASTVREGEFATVRDAGNIPQRIRAQYNSAISGQKMDAEVRQDFVDRSKKLYDQQKSNQEVVNSRFTKRAEQAGIPARAVIDDIDSYDRSVATVEAKAEAQKASPFNSVQVLPTVETQEDGQLIINFGG